MKVFGSGTKLIVTNTGQSAQKPKATILSSSKEEMERTGQVVYLCLLEGFFPNVIKVMWQKGSADVESEQGEIKEDQNSNKKNDGKNNILYSVSSWIKVSTSELNKKFTCRYKHEGISNPENWDEISIDGLTKEDTSIYPSATTQRAAYLTYLLLIMKSALYGPIMFFIIYRARK
ncbi:hypothetical protein GDO86_011528 [Hymenochirus boettgeri]|uniref:Ig-like domain-containing protein n=1 Tax=Hymenochirus boettgeri TaxID=247094 RepID=A0A8T2JEN2_9PIPI|nr:hypothetical protein GDO86_011528 [Hymenochirus boettgeri]